MTREDVVVLVDDDRVVEPECAYRVRQQPDLLFAMRARIARIGLHLIQSLEVDLQLGKILHTLGPLVRCL